MAAIMLLLLPLIVVDCRILVGPDAGPTTLVARDHASADGSQSQAANSESRGGEESGVTPYIMSERTLSGRNDVVGIDRILFPPSYSSLPQPLRNVVNTVVRIPVIIAGLIVGENAELMGLQALQVGNALLMAGIQGLGYSLRDYAIGFIAFGRTVKQWFVYNNIPAFNDTGRRPSVGYFWNKIGEAYLQTRLQVETMYGAHL